MAVKVAP